MSIWRRGFTRRTTTSQRGITRTIVSLCFLLSLSLPSVWASTIIRLATTTSTYHSGLLDHLLPEFEKASGYTVQVLAAGTGKALKMGESGDVDMVMTHAPAAEQSFVAAGFGVMPRPLMYNDFILVGPTDDPASIRRQNSISQALLAIATSNATFISRGDDSGTHKKERALWSAIEHEPAFSNYKETGQGMGSTLAMTNELQGYTLTDRGTWLAYQHNLDLAIIQQGDVRLFNPYQVILVNPRRWPDINHHAAKQFSDWLISEKAQSMINAFKVNGEQLFIADARQ